MWVSPAKETGWGWHWSWGKGQEERAGLPQGATGETAGGWASIPGRWDWGAGERCEMRPQAPSTCPIVPSASLAKHRFRRMINEELQTLTAERYAPSMEPCYCSGLAPGSWPWMPGKLTPHGVLIGNVSIWWLPRGQITSLWVFWNRFGELTLYYMWIIIQQSWFKNTICMAARMQGLRTECRTWGQHWPKSCFQVAGRSVFSIWFGFLRGISFNCVYIYFSPILHLTVC